LAVNAIPGPILKRLIEAEGCFDARDFVGAAAIYERVLKQLPGQINALVMLSRVRMILGEPAKAVELARRAASIAPDDAGVLVCLGNALVAADKGEEGVAALERAIAAGYAGEDAKVALTDALVRLGRDADAVARMDAWETRGFGGDGAPGWVRHAKLAMNRGAALLTLGRVREAIATYEAGVAAHPGDAALRSALLTALNYDETVEAGEVLAAHRGFGARVRAETPPDLGVMRRDVDAGRVLRVGLLSPDFREHSVAWFVGPIVKHVDASRVRLVCAYAAANSDGVTERLRTLAREGGHEWLDVGGLGAVELAKALREANLDVLVELSGHTHGHRLRALAMRCAPVQVTYLGYPNTTGLQEMDVRLVDSRTDPEGAEALATETLVRLDPCFVCFGPELMGARVTDARAEPPMVGRGRVTFASFNAVQKVGPRCLELWKRVLDGVPDSRLVLKGLALGQASAAESLTARIAAAGIDVARVELLAPDATRAAHLERYRDVDIGLDTFPYHGTTTTCQALMMGVPVVTRVGDRHASRVGDSLLHAVGLGALAARSDEEFARVAIALARDVDALTRVRAGLIKGFAASALCDGAAFAKRFEGAMRDVWGRWCARHPDGVMASGDAGLNVAARGGEGA
jgi:hypothetical protein